MSVKITLKRTVRPQNPKRTIVKKVLYSNTVDGKIVVSSIKTVKTHVSDKPSDTLLVNTSNVSNS